jgi:hypothetical protein
MSLNDWLAWAVSDAGKRGLSELRPLLEGLARVTAQLRSASWNDDASGSVAGAGKSSPDAR